MCNKGAGVVNPSSSYPVLLFVSLVLVNLFLESASGVSLLTVPPNMVDVPALPANGSFILLYSVLGKRGSMGTLMLYAQSAAAFQLHPSFCLHHCSSSLSDLWEQYFWK
jgi:hypothetical protein